LERAALFKYLQDENFVLLFLLSVLSLAGINVESFRYMIYKREVKLLHVSAFFGHLQGDIERRKIEQQML